MTETKFVYMDEPDRKVTVGDYVYYDRDKAGVDWSDSEGMALVCEHNGNVFLEDLFPGEEAIGQRYRIHARNAEKNRDIKTVFETLEYVGDKRDFERLSDRNDDAKFSHFKEEDCFATTKHHGVVDTGYVRIGAKPDTDRLRARAAARVIEEFRGLYRAALGVDSELMRFAQEFPEESLLDSARIACANGDALPHIVDRQLVLKALENAEGVKEFLRTYED